MTLRTLRLLLGVLSCAVVGVAVPQHIGAQQSRNVVLGFSGGASLPSGDFGKLASTGYDVSANLYVNSRDTKKNLSFRGDFNYEHWSAKTKELGTFRGIGFFGNGLYTLGNKNMSARPYVIAGGGIHNFQRSFPTNTGDAGTGEVSDTKIAVQGGIGLQFYLQNFSTFLEGRYTVRFGESRSYWIPITFGFHF